MKPLSEIFVLQFNSAMRKWLMTKPRLHQHVADKQTFVEMNRDEFVQVRINYLSKDYFEKHITDDPDRYYEGFLEAIRPALIQLLKNLNMEHHTFAFLFSGRALRATRFVHVGTN